MNDFPDNMSSVTRMFADDSCLQHSSSDVTEIENVINDDLNQINS